MKNRLRGAPAWTIPVIIVVIVVSLIMVARKERRAVENPLVDLVIITVGVFAFAAVFRVIGYKLNAPGFASFFGANKQTSDVK